MPDMKPKFSLGLLLSGTSVSIYVYEFIKWMLASEHLELRAVFVRPPSSGAAASYLPDHWQEDCESKPRPVNVFLFSLVLMLERLLLLKNRDHRHHLQKFDLLSLVPDRIIRKAPDSSSDFSDQPDLDLLIAFAAGPFSKDILLRAKLGVIALSPSDNRVYRGGPPGFWEVYFREDVTGFTIQHLQLCSRKTETIFRGRVATQFYYLLNQASLFKKSNHYLRQVVDRIAITGTLPASQEKLPFSELPRRVPASGHILRYASGLGRILFSKILQKLGGDHRWKVAFLPGAWRSAALWRARIIENEPGHYLADPFAITRGGNTYCFVEDYDIARQRGRITVYGIVDGQATYIGAALQEDFHLSYPYLFHYDGELYMCPESSAVREIRVYKCVEFPLRWKLESTIMKGVSAAD